MSCDPESLAAWTAWEHLTDSPCHSLDQLFVLSTTAHGVSLPAAGTHLCIRKTFLFSFGEGVFFDQDALPLIALARAAEANYDCPQGAVFAGSPGQCSIAAR
jgi:hypothetical protein